ncbi:DUF397 domain-containing protein [Streptomyces cinerochromogenes]|uniref:DUF397 domain-containing protein n=1 Tax=Streptomyces cinerochromogenes TaxID=66422 RepID=UPI00166F9AD8|nr:DUF397 domain-containing protein [Streptomyces cinerochromogenes]GGS78743.1 hypothetical protein GCM10010206_46480 [Streptomyces cinerochromogenes]
MTLAVHWRKSSFSGGGEGNSCVEVAHLDTHISVRDSKAPARSTLTFPAPAFVTFLDALKAPMPSAGAVGCLPG